eukprot:1152485-Pelagomonas_calceolata.AAC.1
MDVPTMSSLQASDAGICCTKRLLEKALQCFCFLACRLVGTSNVPKTGDFLLDAFLMLPTDALAIMDAQMILE